MAYLDEHKAKFENLTVSLDIKNRDYLRRKANGGNSIIFSYKPDEEHFYLEKAKELLPQDQFMFIDIALLLVEFIDKDGWKEFESYYKDFQQTAYVVFNGKKGDDDLMTLIVQKILHADEQGLVPVLVRTGALYGTGIENVNIMEHKDVMGLKNPLVIFYPATLDNENLFFLNFKPASRYRCTVIE